MNIINFINNMIYILIEISDNFEILSVIERFIVESVFFTFCITEFVLENGEIDFL